VVSGGADEIPHAKEGRISDRRVAVTRVNKRAPNKDETSDRRVAVTRVNKPAPNKDETSDRRVAVTRVDKRAPNKGTSEKAGKPAKEDRGRDGRPGRGLDE